MDRSPLGKLIAVHGVSASYQQRAAAVAGLSFLFFLAMMVAFYARAHFGYFLLSTAFLVVFAFTMAGWWMQRRNVVEIFDRGVAFRGLVIEWEDIADIEREPGGALRLTAAERGTVSISRTVHAIDALETHIRGRCGRRHIA